MADHIAALKGQYTHFETVHAKLDGAMKIVMILKAFKDHKDYKPFITFISKMIKEDAKWEHTSPLFIEGENAFKAKQSQIYSTIMAWDICTKCFGEQEQIYWQREKALKKEETIFARKNAFVQGLTRPE